MILSVSSIQHLGAQPFQGGPGGRKSGLKGSGDGESDISGRGGGIFMGFDPVFESWDLFHICFICF